MAVKQVFTCDLTGKYLGEDEGATGSILLNIQVPGGEDPKVISLSAEHADPDLAELLLRTLVTHLNRSGLYVWANGEVRTVQEPATAAEG